MTQKGICKPLAGDWMALLLVFIDLLVSGCLNTCFENPNREERGEYGFDFSSIGVKRCSQNCLHKIGSHQKKKKHEDINENSI
jgi:hypothetical protein